MCAYLYLFACASEHSVGITLWGKLATEAEKCCGEKSVVAFKSLRVGSYKGWSYFFQCNMFTHLSLPKSFLRRVVP